MEWEKGGNEREEGERRKGEKEGMGKERKWREVLEEREEERKEG